MGLTAKDNITDIPLQIIGKIKFEEKSKTAFFLFKTKAEHSSRSHYLPRLRVLIQVFCLNQDPFSLEGRIRILLFLCFRARIKSISTKTKPKLHEYVVLKNCCVFIFIGLYGLIKY